VKVGGKLVIGAKGIVNATIRAGTVLFEGHCRMTKARPVEVTQSRPRDFGVVPLKRSEVQR
jgi:cytoskeletal protein CcmA (bactofilin family)